MTASTSGEQTRVENYEHDDESECKTDSDLAKYEHDEENDGWTVVVPLSDDSSNHDTSLPKIRFACGPSHTDKQVGQEWCESVELELNTAIVLDKSAKFDIESSSNRHHFGVVGSYRAKKKEEL